VAPGRFRPRPFSPAAVFAPGRFRPRPFRPRPFSPTAVFAHSHPPGGFNQSGEGRSGHPPGVETPGWRIPALPGR